MTNAQDWWDSIYDLPYDQKVQIVSVRWGHSIKGAQILLEDIAESRGDDDGPSRAYMPGFEGTRVLENRKGLHGLYDANNPDVNPDRHDYWCLCHSHFGADRVAALRHVGINPFESDDDEDNINVWASFRLNAEGHWIFQGFTPHEEVITEREELAEEDSYGFFSVFLGDYVVGAKPLGIVDVPLPDANPEE